MKTLDQLGISHAPWSVTPNKFGSYDVTAKDSTLVVAYDPPFDEPKDSRNKRLIAAAPDLYEALLECVGEMCKFCKDTEIGKSMPCEMGCETMRRAKAALENAGGAK